MSDTKSQLEGIPAVLYTPLWQARELGFLKTVLEELKIQTLKILIYAEDYHPGGLVIIDGEKGDFEVKSIESPEGVEYDGAIIGTIKPFALLLNESHLIIKGLWFLLKGKLKLKGKRKLWKFLKLLLRCI